MPRSDLLALTADDLATLTNRGTVKRAQKELESGDFSCELVDDASGELIFKWSDGTVCRFPSGRTVHDAVCSSGLAGISRHVVRSVLAYQAMARSEATMPTIPGDQSTRESSLLPSVAAPNEPTSTEQSQLSKGLEQEPRRDGDLDTASDSTWDPGTIDDEALTANFRKPAMTQARKRFEQGVIVELTRGAKPTARFLNEGFTIRFLVPGDPRYVAGDCAQSQLPMWVPQAVWAFRELPQDRLAGLVCLQHSELPVPQATLKSLDGLFSELCRDGLSGVADSWPQRLSRVEQALRSDGLVWPAELVADLLNQCAMYREHDARFEPQQLVELVGESIVRMRAISGNTRSVPQPLIRGTKSDRPAEIASGRMIGIGLGVRPGRGHATVSAYLQDVDSGNVVAVQRTFADPDAKSGQSPRSFSDLAGSVLMRGVSLASLATSQLLLKSGKRTPGGQLMLPRTAGNLATHPQTFQWEQLKPPLAAESFAEVGSRLETLPPASLRARRCTENLHVVAVAGADQVHFDVAHQQLVARLSDTRGGFAELVHPYHYRGGEGFEQLQSLLQQRGGNVRFVCGHVRSTGRLLQMRPICLIVEDGQRRFAIQPWLAGASVGEEGNAVVKQVAQTATGSSSPIDEFRSRLDEQLADLLLTGLAHCSVGPWNELTELTRRLGMTRLAKSLAGLSETLTHRAGTLRWDAEHATRLTKELCMLARLASEL